MKNKIKKVSGKLVVKEISFDYMMKKKVIKNNNTSGKVLLPKDLIDKSVYVVWYE